MKKETRQLIRSLERLTKLAQEQIEKLKAEPTAALFEKLAAETTATELELRGYYAEAPKHLREPATFEFLVRSAIANDVAFRLVCGLADRILPKKCPDCGSLNNFPIAHPDYRECADCGKSFEA